MAILLIVSPLASLSKTKTAVKNSELQGWKISYLHDKLGRVEFEYCVVGATLRTPLTNVRFRPNNGQLEDGRVCFYNPDAKTYLMGTPKTFEHMYDRIFKGQDDASAGPSHSTGKGQAKEHSPDRRWRNRLVSKIPGGKLHGFDTTLFNFDHFDPDHPDHRFPDKIWVSTELSPSKDFLRIICGVADTPHELPGLPLKVVQTVHINPSSTKTVLDAQSIEKKTFKESDFDPPAGYKRSTNESDLIDIGPFVH
jgi:hypothetical protein